MKDWFLIVAVGLVFIGLAFLLLGVFSLLSP